MTWDFTVARKVKVTMEGYVEDILMSYDMERRFGTFVSLLFRNFSSLFRNIFSRFCLFSSIIVVVVK